MVVAVLAVGSEHTEVQAVGGLGSEAVAALCWLRLLCALADGAVASTLFE